MRFLGIGDYCDLSALYLRLAAEGHEVRIFVSEPQCHGTLAGMIPRVDDWEAELPWLRDAGPDGIVIFENVSYARGSRQDALRAEGFNVIGGSAFGDRLENDRAYAQRVLQDLGLQVAPIRGFSTLAEVDAFLVRRPGRYVLKFNGDGFGAADTYVGRLADGRDVRAMAAAKFRQMERSHIDLVLMDHVEGVEMGVGAYFDGTRFLTPACLDWEHKHFFPGDLGELTGEMGTVVTYDRSATFFERTLARVAPLLRQHGYCGYINLNTIVNDRGIWPLEFTCRFGYPGYAILDPLQKTSWSALFKAMVSRSGLRFETAPGFAVGIVMTTRPFPFIRTYVPEPIGLPVLFDGELTDKDRRNLHFGEMGFEDGTLVTAGYHGWTMVVTGTGDALRDAQAAAYRLAARVVVPNVRYRNDIGTRLLAGGLAEVERLGLLDLVDRAADPSGRAVTALVDRQEDRRAVTTGPEPLPHRGLYTRLRASPGKGIGVFAIRDIPQGCNPFAGDDAGTTWVPASVVEAIADVALRRMYLDFCPLIDGRYLAPRDFNRITLSWYMNHSDAPNMSSDADVHFRTNRVIAAGEELTADYRSYSDHAAAVIATWPTEAG